MIYLISNKIDTTNLDGIESLSVKESVDTIRSWPVVQFDTETTGLDARICKLTSLQFGFKDYTSGETTQIVVDCNSINPEEYKAVIENSYLIGHNLKFDLKFLYNHGIVPLSLYDTMICEQVLYLGYSPAQVSMKLSEVLKRYTGIEMDKSYQAVIANKGLTEKGIRYAANDVVYLQDIRKAQIAVAKTRNCTNAFIVENRFVPAIAYLEWCGVHLDESKWRSKMTEDQKQLEERLKKLNNYVISNTYLNKDFVSTPTQLSLFVPESVATQPFCTVDWNSPRQTIPVFQKLGFDTKTKDERDTVDEKHISVQKGIDDKFLQLYFDYKEAFKNVSTYGQPQLNQINPKTGRLHTAFHQLGTVTGRMSSGSAEQNKDLARYKHLFPSEVSYCNLQNLPSKGEIGKVTRACFTAESGNVFVSCDYSAEESRVQADVWNEQSLLDSFKNGIDTHNLYAKMCFPDELKNVDVKDVKSQRPDLRQLAKSAEFAVGYGSDGTSIAAAVGMPVEKARAMVQGILKGMPGMAKFKKETGEFLKTHGYIIINHKTGHRVYWPEWSEWLSEEGRFTPDFWTDYRMYHKGTGDDVHRMVRRHMTMSHDWFGKNVLNYPIQGGSAIVLKQAAADLFEWVIKHGYFNKILFCVFVHDEIDCECPKELEQEFSSVMERIMEKAAWKYYKKLRIPAEVSCGDHWIH